MLAFREDVGFLHLDFFILLSLLKFTQLCFHINEEGNEKLSLTHFS